MTQEDKKIMTKAQERALEVYPRYEKYTTSQRLIVNDMRDGFIQGYEYAEKDVKDALLKWAEEKYSLCKERILEGVPGFEYKLPVYEKLIEKINEL